MPPQMQGKVEDDNYAAKIKQSLSTGQNRLRRNKGTPADIMAIRQNNITAPTDGAMLTGGINSLNTSGVATN